MVLLGSLVLGLGVVEAYARARSLDRAIARATAVAGRHTGSSEFQPAPDHWDLPYLPRFFRLDEQQLETAWGSCRFDHPGPTILVFGDSTTRQASSGNRSRSQPFPPDSDRDALARHEARRTWPAALAATLSPDTQLCVVAEDGYHPADYRELTRHLLPLLNPEQVIVLLCENDLQAIAAREAVPGDQGWMVVYELPHTRPVFPPLWQPQLYEWSEAFRFVHLRLALATGRRVDITMEHPTLPWAESLREIAEAVPTRLVFLPPLVEPGLPSATHAARLGELGLPVQVISLPPPFDPWRRDARDEVHLSDEGHAEVARQIAAP